MAAVAAAPARLGAPNPAGPEFLCLAPGIIGGAEGVSDKVSSEANAAVRTLTASPRSHTGVELKTWEGERSK